MYARAASHEQLRLQAVKSLVLIDAQGFIDGVTPLPRPLAILGVAVLKQIWLRNMANQVRHHFREDAPVSNLHMSRRCYNLVKRCFMEMIVSWVPALRTSKAFSAWSCCVFQHPV